MKRLFLFLCVLIFNIFNPCIAYEYELSICAIFQNEARFLKEWIDYHVIVGVEHFWLYNNESTDEYLVVLQPYIDKGIVECFDWPDTTPEIHFAFGCQARAYQDALTRSTNITNWLCVIDVDEFIVPREGYSVKKLIKKYFKHEKFLAIYWQKFGTSNVKEIMPGELMIEKLVMKAHENDILNNWYKSIFKPKYVTSISNPHFPDIPPKYNQVDASGFFQLNHYWTRDELFFLTVKCPRYEKWHAKTDLLWFQVERLNAEKDTLIQKFVPLLKK